MLSVRHGTVQVEPERAKTCQRERAWRTQHRQTLAPQLNLINRVTGLGEVPWVRTSSEHEREEYEDVSDHRTGCGGDAGLDNHCPPVDRAR